MLELLVAATVFLVVCSVIGVLVGLFSAVLWLLTLPFRLLGLMFHGLGWLLVLPLLLVGVLIACVATAVALPALPIVLLVLGIVVLMRRRGTARPA